MTERPVTTAAPGTWTTRTLLDWMTRAFEAKDLDEPRLCAEMLLTHVLGCQRLRLYMEADRPASAQERERLRGLVGRALKHEPIQYLIGRWPFFGIELKTDKRALIPRPSTETIVESVLQWRRAAGDPAAPLRIADICCGGGAIAIALAKNLPGARVIATDLSQEALSLAAENIADYGLAERIELRLGDLLDPLAGEAPLDVIVSNPPYIPDDEWAAVEANVRDYEPEMALRAGPDGMQFVRPLLEQVGGLLAPGGRVLVEVAASRVEDARGMAEGAGLAGVQVLKDIDGLPRVIVGGQRGRGVSE
ncbi:MAG: peptide chain release factor N(5)-glutamine methyltransferase [Phycisphaerales bacterium JB039]